MGAYDGSRAMDDKAITFLMFRAIRGVIRSAENGNLPLFTRTLGLPSDQYLAMMTHYFPEYAVADELSQPSYQFIQSSIPNDFPKELNKVLSQNEELADQQLRIWLAHAIASAAYGEQALWQSMELANVLQLHILLDRYFAQKNGLKHHASSWQTWLFDDAEPC